MSEFLVSICVWSVLSFSAALNGFGWQDSAKPAPAAVVAPTAEFHAEPSAQRLARGKYLVEDTAHCFLCHGQSDFGVGLGQPKPGTEGSGQIIKDDDNDDKIFPDGITVPNITPDMETGAGSWADWQFERAIRHGIGHDGRKLIDLMPYSYFRSLTDEDVTSVIVYIRSLPAVRHTLPKMRVNYEVKTSMHPEMEAAVTPDATDQIRRGWYLVRVAQCSGCHTPYDENGAPVADKMFGGGLHFKGDWGEVVTPNITCHPSGISHYDAAMFIKTIRTGRSSGGVRDLATIMPYSYFRRMNDEDLSAIFAFIHSVKPVFHEVDNSEPPTFCVICKEKHGLGDRN
jgi:mono/diheme cytochrome c family protein